MEKLLKMLPKSNHHMVLTVLLSFFIIFNIHIPLAVSQMLDNPLAKGLIAVGALSLLSVNKVMGAIAIVAAYVLIQRIAEKTGTIYLKRHVPSETKKYVDMQAFNDIEMTVEEEIINNMLPLTSNDEVFPPEYKPTQEDLHDAAKL
tara:strand:+ start:1175 stop:1612 length:438 start_codon:yes stop_codon:yes gene_type:complete